MLSGETAELPRPAWETAEAAGAEAAAKTPAPAAILGTTAWSGTCQRRTTLFTSRDGYGPISFFFFLIRPGGHQNVAPP